MFAAEVVGGYLGAGLVALGLNRTKYDFESGWKDWRRFLVRSTVLSLASAIIVYAIGEKYGSGKGRFVDSLKDSLYAPVGIGSLPCGVRLISAAWHGRYCIFS